MKKLITLFIFLSTLGFAQYTTPGTGVVWTLDSLVTRSGGVVTGSGSAFTINALVTVSANDRVVVGPGKTVTFSAAAAGIEVNGAFTAIGDSLHPNTFTGPVSNTGGSWVGFRFNDTAIDSLCKIVWANIEYANYGFRCIGCDGVLRNSHLLQCGRGVQLSSSSPIISNNIIENCYEYGITLTLGSSPMISFNTIHNNNVQNTSPKTQITIGTQGINSPTILFNRISGIANNKTGGIAISCLFAGSSCASEIAHNEIYGNTYGIALTGGTITANIHHNYIHDNVLIPDPMNGGSGINVNGTSPNAPVIHHNIVKGNYWGATVQNGTSIQAGPLPNFGNVVNSDSTDNGFNVFVDNKQGNVRYDFFNNTTTDIYAQNNYWGVSDSVLIEGRVVHKVDSTARGYVFFLPFIDSTVVPVELVGFTTKVIGSKTILLWQTVTETNNRGFEIWFADVKSSFVKPSESDYTYLGFLSGAGTTTSKQNYLFEDNSGSGSKLYRVYQLDFDGTKKLVASTEVDNNSLITDFALSQNYPNPFNPSTTIKFSIGGSEAKFATITLYNSLGEEVAVLFNGIATPGNHSVELNSSSGALKNMTSGVYFYKLTSGSFTETKKLVLMK